MAALGMTFQYISSFESTKAEGSTSRQQAAGTSNCSNEEEELFEDQCLKRQLYRPKLPYPAWDYNWDGNETSETSLTAAKKVGIVGPPQIQGKTRHIILVRHGQYDEMPKDDEQRILTPLGRLQAIQTGKRLREIMEGSENFDKERFRGSCPVTAVRVSNMTRAKETAQLIAAEIGLNVEEPDPDLNEALPAPMIPIRPDIIGATEEIDQHHERIERAFQKYFYRDMSRQETEKDENLDQNDRKDDFEIIVCHGNVIRYFFCRALQLPPEAWLRMSTFNCSLTYLMIRPSGYVSCRMLGDIGHLKYNEVSFSGYHGFKW